MSEREVVTAAEWRWVAAVGLVAVAAFSIPYLVAWSYETPERVFSGCILLVEDCYSYLYKMRQGADGGWFFHIAYTPEGHPGALLFLLHQLLGKVASAMPGDDLTAKIVVVYHITRVLFGLGLLLVVYWFLAKLTRSVPIRRLTWMMVALGGGMGWLLTALGHTRWLGDVPLDLYLPEGFAFIVLLGFPHIAVAQSLMLAGFSCLLRAWGASGPDHAATISSIKWAGLTGLAWFLMGLIAPFSVAVAWAVAGAAWVTLCLRRQGGIIAHWREASVVVLAALISASVVLYTVWVFTSNPVYAAWAAQSRIISPHPLHYLAAYGVPLALAAFGAKDVWRGEGWAWLALSWVAVVPLLVYLPTNVQLRLTTGVQVPLSFLAAQGALGLWRRGRRWLTLSLLTLMIPTALFLLVSSTMWMMGRPSPSFRDASEVAALNWLAARAQAEDVVLTAYDSGSYLPARVSARVLVGHDLEGKDSDIKRALVNRFFHAEVDDVWRKRFLAQYGVDYVLWGPAERSLGRFDPRNAPYLRQAYAADAYAVFVVEL